MKKFVFIAVATLMSCQSAFAALSPLNQSIAELKAILNSDKIKGLGQAHSIQGIQKTEQGYVLTTSHTKLRVDLVYKPSKVMGPAQFELVFFPVNKNESVPTE